MQTHVWVDPRVPTTKQAKLGIELGNKIRVWLNWNQQILVSLAHKIC